MVALVHLKTYSSESPSHTTHKHAPYTPHTTCARVMTLVPFFILITRKSLIIGIGSLSVYLEFGGCTVSE